METIANERWALFLESNKKIGRWKEIADYDHKSYWYISDHGRVKVTNNYNDQVHWPKIYLTGGHPEKRYAALSINYAPTKYIHRLVALYFIANPENSRTVNHIDGNPLNNHFQNLEWATHGENIRHGAEMRRNGLNPNRHSQYQQSLEEINQHDPRMPRYEHIKALRLEGMKISDIADITGMPRGTVASIVRWWKARGAQFIKRAKKNRNK